MVRLDGVFGEHGEIRLLKEVISDKTRQELRENPSIQRGLKLHRLLVERSTHSPAHNRSQLKSA